MAAILVIAFSGSNDSGAAGTAAGPLEHNPSQARELTATPRAAPDKCPSARRAVIYYARRLTQWRAKTGAGQSEPINRANGTCPRYLAHVLQRKAARARHLYLRWSHEWEWQRWLPAKFARVGRCETGHTWGQDFPAGNWRWDSGKYVSAFGILRSAYESYHPWTGHNTPREQYEVARSIQRRYGWDAWGCRAA